MNQAKMIMNACLLNTKIQTKSYFISINIKFLTRHALCNRCIRDSEYQNSSATWKWATIRPVNIQVAIIAATLWLSTVLLAILLERSIDKVLPIFLAWNFDKNHRYITMGSRLYMCRGARPKAWQLCICFCRIWLQDDKDAVVIAAAVVNVHKWIKKWSNVVSSRLLHYLQEAQQLLRWATVWPQ